MGILDIFKRKAKKTQKRTYAGANTGRLFSDFNASNRSADEEIRYALETLRNRSRDLTRNNEYAKRFVTLTKVNVVGERGVSLQVKAKNLDNTYDAVGNSIIEDAWASWGKLGVCTVDGRLSWADAQRLFVECLVRDGEVLIRKVKYPNEYGFALEFIEPELLDEKKNEVAENGNRIKMGVELDNFNRPVAYHLRSSHPNDISGAGSMSYYPTIRIPADKIIHAYLPERAQQTRGVPALSTAIFSLKMLAGYREAELVAARVGASKMGFFTSPDGDGFVGDDEEDSVPIMEASPATFHQLPKGVDFKAFDPSNPNTAFAEFEKAILRGIASGLGISYTSLANDLEGVSYSSIRQGALEDRDNWKVLQDFVIQHFVEPIFRDWLRSAMENGSINLPATKFDKFANAAHFRARGFQWVDPQREISAAVIAMNNGIMSLQDVSNVYGRDIEETFDQIKLENELADARGIKLAFQPFGGGGSAYGAQKITPQTGEPVADQEPTRQVEQVINLNPEFIVKTDPMEITLNMQSEDKPARSKKIKLIRNEDGAVIGAETLED